jgi:simple sugar transport system substrate-binding protein
LKYSNDPDASKQATLIRNAIDSKVDGIAATLAAPDAVGPTLKAAADAKIPTVALNAGLDVYRQYGALMYFGSDEKLAGQSAGKRLADEGAKKILCIVHAQGVISLEDRCAGVKSSFANTENLQVNGADLSAATTAIQAKLAEDKSITDIVTLDAGVATAVTKAKQDAGSDAKVVTFDLNEEVVQGIQNGDIEFCIDQQPYLQGYEAVDTLWLYLTNGNDLGGGQPVLTGPSFVDQNNIDAIAKFAQNNTR